MKFGKFLIAATYTLLGIQKTLDTEAANNPNGSTVAIPESEKKAIISIMNQARRETSVAGANLNAVAWDYGLEQALYKYAEQVTPAGFFAWVDEPQFGTPGTHSYAGYHVMEQEPFKSDFPGYITLMHDTCQLKSNSVAFIFNYRSKSQKDCIDYKACDSNEFQDYITCTKGAPVKVPGQHCSWAWQYLPRMLNANIEKIACVLFQYTGPNAPNKKVPGSFWCYSNGPFPSSDQPYAAGARCSQCGSSKCVNGLCVPGAATMSLADEEDCNGIACANSTIAPTLEPSTHRNLRAVI